MEHLICSICDHRGHLATRCYKKLTFTAIALADDNISRFTAQIKGFDVKVILETGAIRPFNSKSLVVKLNLYNKLSKINSFTMANIKKLPQVK